MSTKDSPFCRTTWQFRPMALAHRSSFLRLCLSSHKTVSSSSVSSRPVVHRGLLVYCSRTYNYCWQCVALFVVALCKCGRDPWAKYDIIRHDDDDDLTCTWKPTENCQFNLVHGAELNWETIEKVKGKAKWMIGRLRQSRVKCKTGLGEGKVRWWKLKN